jgi:ATP-dependent Lon protease
MPVSLNNSEKAIQEFLYNSFDILRKTIYGQSNAKNKIMQILAQWITNPKSTGQVIALEGAPGVGKTSLVKNGVSKALNRPFSFYALGGETDVSNLEGHSYTYEGAHWGRITEMLMESKVMNPVIFFDELDKISNSYKGNEINGLLTHLTDPSQNNIFQDKYFSGIDIDL